MRAFVVLQVASLALLTGCPQQKTDDVGASGSAAPAAQSAASSEAQAAVESALEKGDAMAVATAIAQFKKTGSKRELTSLLIRGLGNTNDDVRETCSQQLVDLAPDSHEAVVALMEEGLQDDDPVVRQHAAEALGQIGPPAKDAVPALDQLQRNETESDDVRKAASLALEQINDVPESPADTK